MHIYKNALRWREVVRFISEAENVSRELMYCPLAPPALV